MTKHAFILFAVCASAVLSACDNFKPGSLIATPRVLGARIEVRGEPERSAPKPAETVDIGWITAAPNDAQTFHWAFALCLPEAAANGSCANAPLAFAEESGLAPTFSFQVPTSATLADAESVYVLGVICDRGSPGVDAQGTPRCAGERAHGTSVRLEVVLELNDHGNLNPELDDTTIALDTQVWDAAPEASDATGCAGNAALPQVKANGEKHLLTIEIGADVRELYTTPTSGRSQLEALQISHFTTAGELEGQYSFVEASDPTERPELSFDWHAPEAKEVASDGERVRFVFVVRDMRGGLAVTERALCAVR